MAQHHHFAARIRWTGAAHGSTRNYKAYSREYTVEIDGRPPLKGSADRAFLGDPALHNPEDMLIAALSACHMLSFLAEAARKGVAVVDYEDAASATMALERGGGRFTEAVLRPRVTLAPGTDASAVEGLHEAAHAFCFIANSVNFPVRHDATTVVADAAQ